MLDVFWYLSQARGQFPRESDHTPQTFALRAHDYRAPDGDAAEHEVTVFVAALAYATKPPVILETGAYEGFTTRSLGFVAATYGGKVYGLEHDPGKADRAREVTAGLPVTICNASSTDPTHAGWPVETFDFVFVDCVPPPERMHVLDNLVGRCNPHAWLAIHDTAPHHGGLAQYLRFFGAHLVIPTPRGLIAGRFQ